MVTACRLQPARTDDLDTLVRMMRAYFAYDGHAFDASRARDAMARLLTEDARGLCWLILCDEAPAGYAVLTFGYSLEYHGTDAFVDELFVDEPFRGRGLGRAAIAVMETACRARGVRALHLEVERRNERAQRLYRRLGFADHDRYLMTRTIT